MNSYVGFLQVCPKVIKPDSSWTRPACTAQTSVILGHTHQGDCPKARNSGISGCTPWDRALVSVHRKWSLKAMGAPASTSLPINSLEGFQVLCSQEMDILKQASRASDSGPVCVTKVSQAPSISKAFQLLNETDIQLGSVKMKVFQKV